MKLEDFDYELPQELIAQKPVTPRDHSNLLVVNKNHKTLLDKKFYDIIDFLDENDVLVINETKVIKARLKGRILREEGKFLEVEIFLHKQKSDNIWDCLVYPGKKLKPGTKVIFNNGLEANIKNISENGRLVEFNIGGLEFLKLIDKIGEIPLPPYIKTKLESIDRYQTIWAKHEGSVAAPTASLHFTKELLEKIAKKGVKIEKVLLHVGLGTFKPVNTENIEEHYMHSEYIEIKEEVANNLNEYKKQGKRIIAVGTTSIRVLESMTNNYGIIIHGNKQTDIFIYPGYKWKFVDAIITNFHLPKSTLLMLISSFIGLDFTKELYSYAVRKKYRFFSFGDAMFIK